MIYLGIRTDAPTAQFYLHNGTAQIATQQWQADRELAHQLLAKLEAFLVDNKVAFKELDGLYVFKGPGSFTGLRIGITVMNTMSYALSIPIVGMDGNEWANEGVTRLRTGDNDRVVLPTYGADARITKPRK